MAKTDQEIDIKTKRRNIEERKKEQKQVNRRKDRERKKKGDKDEDGWGQNIRGLHVEYTMLD